MVWCAVLALTLALLLARPALAEAFDVYHLPPGTANVVTEDFTFEDVIVGDSSIADVVPLSPNSFTLQAKAAGITTIILLDSDKTVLKKISVVVEDDFAELQGIINGLDPANRVQVSNSNGRPLLKGSVNNVAAHDRVVEVATSYSQNGLIDALKIEDPRQVMLKVNILELSETGGKQLGVDVFGGTSAVNTLNGTDFGSITGAVAGGSLLPGIDIDYVVQALESKGLAKRLANPTLVSVNGEPASFVVGGEVPIVTTAPGQVDAQGNPISGGSTTTYHEYGVKLSFVPEVLSSSTIRMQVLPEVSEVDWTKRVNDNPAFTSRKVTTTVELTSGQSFAIAGLLQRTSVRNLRQFPWLGDLPVLGALFRSTAFQNSQTELVVIVTPYLVNQNSPLVHPVDPTLQSGTPSEAQLFLLGLVEANDELVTRFKSGIGTNKPFGHIIPEN